MSFLDRLLGRDKKAAGETGDKSAKDEGMRQEDSERPSSAPPSDTIDPQFIKDTEKKANQ